jgi:uncharacterized protein YjbI with pentapeptide repeats
MAAPDPIPDLLKAVNEASGRGLSLWITFLTIAIYLAIAIGATTHAQLLLEAPIRLPLFGVDLPLVAFYEVAPVLFVILHLYVLLQLYLMARALRLFSDELRDAQVIEKDRERIRAQLDKFVLTQMMAGALGIWAMRMLLRFTVWLTLLIAPVLLLLFFQIRFLPYHDAWTTWVQRVALLVDLLVIWWMWPAIAYGLARVRGAQTRIARALLVFMCVLLAGFSVLVVTIPGERAEKVVLQFARSINADNGGRLVWWPTWVLFEGDVDPAQSRNTSLFSRNLVLVDKVLIDPDSDKLGKVARTLPLRGRNLQFAVLDRADLRKADLTEALLQGASLRSAQLQGASLDGAQLQRASLDGAQLQGASLGGTRLPSASPHYVDLQGASLRGAQLQGASLDYAQLQGASLDGAQLQGASLYNAQLQIASLGNADLQGTSLDGAQLQGASLYNTDLQGASLEDANLEEATLNWANLQFAWFHGAQLRGADRRHGGEPREWNEAEDDTKLAKFLAALGCRPMSPPYVAKGLLIRLRRENNPPNSRLPYMPILAQALRDPECAGARDLNADEKADLDKIIADPRYAWRPR